MKRQAPVLHDEYTALILDGEEVEQASEDDLWFLPGPMEEEPDYLPPGPRAEPCEAEVLEDWRKAEAGHAARLARPAAPRNPWRFGLVGICRRGWTIAGTD